MRFIQIKVGLTLYSQPIHFFLIVKFVKHDLTCNVLIVFVNQAKSDHLEVSNSKSELEIHKKVSYFIFRWRHHVDRV